VNKGLAPNSVLSNTQGTSWDEFMTGEYAFAENGSWFKSAADEAGYESIQVPGFTGGVAPAPTGGEFITIPIQKDTSRYATSAKIVECLSTGDTGATALGYVAPTAEGQAAQLAADSTLEFWIDAVGDAKPRTADNLGVSYGIISEQLYTAIQNALSGSATPADALKDAQAAADEKLQ
jgi:multiple sugar transport system substrate-binding protein